MVETNGIHELVQDIKRELFSQGLFEGRSHAEIEEIWQKVNPRIVRAIQRFLKE